ncbi:MAG: Tim44 domain-containing protein [Alphaproteobacteria bacterium]|nr:Tim44 domain-containing protein [Alphaproteobacteria bacterium]
MNFENILLIMLVFYFGWRLYKTFHAKDESMGKIRLVSKKTGQVIELNLLDDKGQPIIQPINSDDAFIMIAKDMFARIVQGFTTGNLDKIRSLISPKVFNVFKGAIENRREKKHHMDFTLVDFKNVELLKTNSEKVRQVSFTTEQINLLRDDKGNVISGDPMYVTTVNEIWTFEQQGDKSWVLSATKQGGENVA